MDIVGRRTLYSIFRDYAAAQPGRNWLTYESADGRLAHWTFSEFLNTVHQAANFLTKFGIGAGDVVTLHLANHPAYPQVILAASCLGATVLPTSPSCTPEELRYFLEHSETKIVITEEGRLESLKTIGRQSNREIVLIEQGRTRLEYPCFEEELREQSATAPEGLGACERVVQLLYTSGTTSRPKAVMLTNANFIYGSEVFRAATGLRNDDRHLIALPLYHSAAQCHALWPSLMAGCSVSIMSRFSASRFFEQAVEHRATMAALFGAPLRMLLNQPERPSDRAHQLRNITFAQNLTTAQYDQWHRRFGVRLQQLWGMTEICALPIMSPVAGERRLNAMGRPVLGYESKVVDESGNEVPPNTPGQLITRGVPGRSLMKGYLKDDAATKKTLRYHNGETWLYSGDTASYDEDGFFYFVDRSSDMIKRSGLNISTSEVESVIAALEGVADVCVCGLPDATRDESVAAVIVPKPDATLTIEMVRAHCAAHLASYKIPERIEFSDALPRTSVGKVRKNILRQQLLSQVPQ